MRRKGMRSYAAVVLSVLMAVSTLTGCGGSKMDNGKVQTSGTAEAGQQDSKKNVNLKWIQVGHGMPDNYDAWQQHLNQYLEEKIGVNLDVEVVSWGDWENRRSVIVNTNEPYDILFTNSNTYVSDVNLGAFYDITDLVQSETPDLYTSLPGDYWNAVEVDGKIYAVPTYKDSSMTQYFVWDKALAEKYGIDYENLRTLDSLTDSLKKMKDGEGKAPFILNSEGIAALPNMNYDAMSLGLPALGVSYKDDSRKVVSVFEQEDIMKQLKILHEWYNEGIINADAATLPENPTYRSCFVAQGWSLAAKTTWGPKMGVEASAVKWGDTIVSNDTVGGSLSCISASCENPEKALQLLQLVNTDSYVRDALYYGLEGENFNYTEDGKIEKLNDEWKMAGYTQGSFFTLSQLADSEVNQWDEVKELNENAIPSPVIGFTVDTSEFQDELANCIEIYNRYKSELLTGKMEPEEEVASMMDEMKDAGFDTIVEKVQEQLDTAF